MRQVVFTDVLTLGRLDVDGQSFASLADTKQMLTLIAHKKALLGYDMLAGTPVTKLIGIHKLLA